MPKGTRITSALKRQIAFEYILGKDLALIAEEQRLSLDALYRLRQKDRVYQQYEAQLEQEAVDRLRLRLKRAVSAVLAGMLQLTRLPHDNEVVKETDIREENGRFVKVEKRTYKTDPKLVLLKYQANERLLDAFLRVVEGEAMVQHADRLLEQRQALLAAYGIEPLTSSPLPAHATPLLDVEAPLPRDEFSELLDGLHDMSRS